MMAVYCCCLVVALYTASSVDRMHGMNDYEQQQANTNLWCARLKSDLSLL